MIRLVVLDVDGVLTTGEVVLDQEGRESKRLFFHDIDAVYEARRRGLRVVLLSGEATPIVGVIAHKLGIDDVWSGRHDKADALAEIARDLAVPLDAVCYIGDSVRDAPAIELAGLGLAPADAVPAAREAADRVLERTGGRGAVSEAIALVLQDNEAQ